MREDTLTRKQAILAILLKLTYFIHVPINCLIYKTNIKQLIKTEKNTAGSFLVCLFSWLGSFGLV
jgi:hypothetical protein